MSKLKKCAEIPFLPGQSNFRQHIAGEKDFYYRKTTLSYELDAPVDKYKENIEYYQDEIEELTRKMQDPSWRLDTTGPTKTHDERKADAEAKKMEDAKLRLKPAWVKHDRQVLRFVGYMQEPVFESAMENCRLRYCTIYYYLEDGTLQIDEPKVENSGIAPQGALAKRHCIPKADGSGMISMADLKCGGDVEVYSKKFRIVSCDPFTRWYYEQVGLDAGEEEQAPEDYFHEKQRVAKERELGLHGIPKNVIEAKQYNAKMLGGGACNGKLEQFIRNDLKVLRFWCYWDDTTRYGERMFSIMNYFLADNTCEFTEVHEKNNGKYPFPCFYRRSPLPKNPQLSVAPCLMTPEPEYYLPKDLIMGSEVIVYGRKFFLYKCDEFTRQFYKEYMGVEQKDIELEVEVEVKPTLPVPPYTGFGGEEDSMASVKALRPKPAQQDLVRIMTMSDKICRFIASCNSGLPEDSERRFIVTLYMCDDTISVYEKKSRNSGFMEGSFAERSRKKGPNGEYYVHSDFFVGSEVVINSMKFHLLRPDEFTMKYMEDNPHFFPLSDINRICHNIKPHVPKEGRETHPDQLLEHFHGEGIEFTDHEMITLVRRFGTPNANIDLDGLRAHLGIAE